MANEDVSKLITPEVNRDPAITRVGAEANQFNPTGTAGHQAFASEYSIAFATRFASKASASPDANSVGVPNVVGSGNGNTTGSTGATGPQGPQGPTGPAGATGPAGPAGTAANDSGDGSDGPFVASGTTFVDLQGKSLYLKNYSSVDISGTSTVTFFNCHPGGTLIVFKCKGDANITSTNTPALSTRFCGGQPGDGGSANSNGTDANSSYSGIFDGAIHYGRKGLSGSNGGATQTASPVFTAAFRGRVRAPGMGGGGGGGGVQATGGGFPGQGGQGGAGASTFILDVGGNLTISGQIDLRGEDGRNGFDAFNPGNLNHNYSGGGGAGGGGAAGDFLATCAGTVSNTGTFLTTGGLGGLGGICPPGVNGGSTFPNGTPGGGGTGGANSSNPGAVAVPGTGNNVGYNGGKGADGVAQILSYTAI